MSNEAEKAKTPQSAGDEGIPVTFPVEIQKGAYTNHAFIGHTDSGEEFTIDFFLMHAAGSTVVSRIISSPQHTKRLAKALLANIQHYEEVFGEIPEHLPKKSK